MNKLKYHKYHAFTTPIQETQFQDNNIIDSGDERIFNL